MEVLAQLIDRLSPWHLEVIAAELAKISADFDFIAYGLSAEVLRFFLGNDWTNCNVFREHVDIPREYMEGRAFLKTRQIDDPESHVRHKGRVTRLAQSLYDLQAVPGVQHRLAMIRAGNLETALGEVECARLFAHPALKLKFIVPKGVKGLDYEADFVAPTGIVIHCEIKTKKETTALSHSTVRSTLDKARKQLPRGKPGLVMLRIPENWVAQAASIAILESAVERVLRQSKRLAGTILVWEEWVEVATNLYGCKYKFRPIYNKQNTLYSDGLEQSIKLAGGVANPGLIRFQTIAAKALAMHHERFNISL
jgi:hypothetical protein